MKDLKVLISKQINDQYKNSLNILTKNQILKQIENFKIEEIPENLVEQEVNILSKNMKEDEIKKNKKNFEERAKRRIKVGLILNEFGTQNNIKIEETEIQEEINKQLKMMPGQEKMVMEYYQKNPSASESLRGTIYEEKIIDLIKSKAKVNKKEVTKEEAEKILKSENEKNIKEETKNIDKTESKKEKLSSSKKLEPIKKAKSTSKKSTKLKKVSKK